MVLTLAEMVYLYVLNQDKLNQNINTKEEIDYSICLQNDKTILYTDMNDLTELPTKEENFLNHFFQHNEIVEDETILQKEGEYIVWTYKFPEYDGDRISVTNKGTVLLNFYENKVLYVFQINNKITIPKWLIEICFEPICNTFNRYPVKTVFSSKFSILVVVVICECIRNYSHSNVQNDIKEDFKLLKKKLSSFNKFLLIFFILIIVIVIICKKTEFCKKISKYIKNNKIFI
jgi:hypothetical protein